MLGVLVILGLVGALLLTASVYERIHVCKLVALAFTVYVSVYAVASGLLFWGNGFTLHRAALITAAVLGAAGGVKRLFRGHKLHVEYELRSVWLLLVILLLAGVISWRYHGGLHDTGQDQGLYQMQAMFYLGGQFDNTVHFDEYVNNNVRWDRQHFVQELQGMDGLYLNDYDPDAHDPKLSGVLHGLHTLPAILALGGHFFGLEGMPLMMLLSYMGTLVLMWYSLRNLEAGKWVTVGGTLVLAFSPLILWISRITLNEGFLLLFVMAFVEIMTEKKQEAVLLGAIPLVGFSFLHVLITVLMPMFVVLYWIQYRMERDRKQLYALDMVLVGYALGLSAGSAYARTYTMSSFSTLFGRLGNILNEDNLVIVVWIVCLAVIALNFFWIRREKKVMDFWKKMTGSRKASGILGLAVIVLLVLYLLIFGQELSWQPTLDWRTRMLIWGYIAFTGIVAFPLSFFLIFRKRKVLLRNRVLFGLVFMFLYVLLVYCKILWVLVRYYYYYSRYIGPFLMLPILLMALVFKKKKIRKLAIPVFGVVLALLVYTGRALYVHQDMTYTQYSTIENLVNCISEEDAVLLYEQGYGIQKTLALPIKGLTGADVYYLNPDSPEALIKHIEHMYENIYELQYDVGKDPLATDKTAKWRVMYKEQVNGSVLDTDVEPQLFPYPHEAIILDTDIVLRLREKDKK